MTFDHDAEDVLIAPGDLRRDILHHMNLAGGNLTTVGMAGIDHDPGGKICLGQQGSCVIRGKHVVIWLLAATQDNVAVLVAGGFENRRVPALGHR